MALVRALAARVAEPQALGDAFAALRRFLDGSAEGKLRNAPERNGLVSAVAALAAAPGRGTSVAQLASTVTEFLCGCYRCL